MEASQQTLFDDTPPAGHYLVPEGGAVEHCRSWGTTDKGHAIPLDVADTLISGGQRYGRTHFATCPHGREWRRSR
jgi:hypothetical protein